MNPTQNPENTAPEPGLPAKHPRFFDLLDKVPGGVGIRARLSAALGNPVDDTVTFEPTETGIAALDTPAPAEEPVAWVAVSGWCEVCGNALPWKRTWNEPLCSACVSVARPDIRPSSNGPAEPPSSCPVDLVTATNDQVTGRVLRSAALYLQRHGWTQGAYYDATTGIFTPPADMVGAIGMVCYGGPVDAPAQHFDSPGFLDFEAAVLHLDRYLLAENGSESYEFNDAKGRRLDDVLYVLRDAATRPADELIDALKAIDQLNADVAAVIGGLLPGGAFAELGEAAAVATDQDSDDGHNFVDCLFCGAPGGYPYCQRSDWPGRRAMSCAEVVAADDADSDGGDVR
ncbi:DUF6197 family protein [Actinoplanes solisilvae]|uniref:DUF6197 family protein n=1 Tax=Actinoplanes solisilvae TaxID=2486853 RepID=UPI000FD972CC|nr:hypothetical protein [Actinoplanes solisilvae]